MNYMLNIKNKQLIKGVFIGFCGSLIAYYILNLTNCFGSRSTHVENIQKLTRQAARWSTAAAQDESPLIAVLHANYAAGYLEFFWRRVACLKFLDDTSSNNPNTN